MSSPLSTFEAALGALRREIVRAKLEGVSTVKRETVAAAVECGGISLEEASRHPELAPYAAENWPASVPMLLSLRRVIIEKCQGSLPSKPLPPTPFFQSDVVGSSISTPLNDRDSPRLASVQPRKSGPGDLEPILAVVEEKMSGPTPMSVLGRWDMEAIFASAYHRGANSLPSSTSSSLNSSMEIPLNDSIIDEEGLGAAIIGLGAGEGSGAQLPPSYPASPHVSASLDTSVSSSTEYRKVIYGEAYGSRLKGVESPTPQVSLPLPASPPRQFTIAVDPPLPEGKTAKSPPHPPPKSLGVNNSGYALSLSTPPSPPTVHHSLRGAQDSGDKLTPAPFLLPIPPPKAVGAATNTTTFTRTPNLPPNHHDTFLRPSESPHLSTPQARTPRLPPRELLPSFPPPFTQQPGSESPPLSTTGRQKQQQVLGEKEAVFSDPWLAGAAEAHARIRALALAMSRGGVTSGTASAANISVSSSSPPDIHASTGKLSERKISISGTGEKVRASYVLTPSDVDCASFHTANSASSSSFHTANSALSTSCFILEPPVHQSNVDFQDRRDRPLSTGVAAPQISSVPPSSHPRRPSVGVPPPIPDRIGQQNNFQEQSMQAVVGVMGKSVQRSTSRATLRNSSCNSRSSSTSNGRKQQQSTTGNSKNFNSSSSSSNSVSRKINREAQVRAAARVREAREREAMERERSAIEKERAQSKRFAERDARIAAFLARARAAEAAEEAEAEAGGSSAAAMALNQSIERGDVLPVAWAGKGRSENNSSHSNKKNSGTIKSNQSLSTKKFEARKGGGCLETVTRWPSSGRGSRGGEDTDTGDEGYVHGGRHNWRVLETSWEFGEENVGEEEEGGASAVNLSLGSLLPADAGR